MERFGNENESPGLALVGNPGAGKSTILNGIADEAIFKSGISCGNGLTTVLQRHVVDCHGRDLTLFDTPGLADIERRIEAGREIDELLSTNMAIKLAFVVTLDNGRVKPDDATTVKLVLQAIKSVDVNNRFGVILNQLSRRVLQELNEDSEKAAKVRKGITGPYHTSHWTYVQKDPALEDADDGKLLTDELVTFFTGLPTTKPSDATVDKIDTSDMEEKIEEQRQRIQELTEANEAQRQEMMRQLEEQKAETEKREKDIKDRLSHLEVELQNAQNEAERERYRHNRLKTGLCNAVALGIGGAAALATANPAPLFVAGAFCRTTPRPRQRQQQRPASSNQ